MKPNEKLPKLAVIDDVLTINLSILPFFPSSLDLHKDRRSSETFANLGRVKP